jgi:hypothetical protein
MVVIEEKITTWKWKYPVYALAPVRRSAFGRAPE